MMSSYPPPLGRRLRHQHPERGQLPYPSHEWSMGCPSGVRHLPHELKWQLRAGVPKRREPCGGWGGFCVPGSTRVTRTWRWVAGVTTCWCSRMMGTSWWVASTASMGCVAYQATHPGPIYVHLWYPMISPSMSQEGCGLYPEGCGLYPEGCGLYPDGCDLYPDGCDLSLL
jgi:hypothetical protein